MLANINGREVEVMVVNGVEIPMSGIPDNSEITNAAYDGARTFTFEVTNQYVTNEKVTYGIDW